jgi:hypothetical protein
MSEEITPLPIEIPWRLVSTTQPLAAGDPDQTSISMFVFEPDDHKLTSEFPKDRLIYIKFVVTVSAASIPNAPPVATLGEGIPCFHLKLDLKIRKASGDLGTIRPYFHSAAPLHRTMVQTGVVGVNLFEGEADSQMIGKSGSQMYESSSTRSRTTTGVIGESFGIPFIGGISASVRSTATDISAQRRVSQIVDTTQRQASEERRQLVSHSTKVENVLALLDGKYLGTPHLSFSLHPQPLQLLSADPSDTNLWYNQLLERRSSGIEGIQEFTAVILVPKGKDFCVNAKLQRVCVLDNPPGPLTYAERYNNSFDHRNRLLGYLNRVYPRGTPLDDLDIDITEDLIKFGGELPRPVIQVWSISRFGTVVATVISPAPKPNIGLYNFGLGNYKHVLEVWLETLRDEYERELSRSPIERGILLGEQRIFDTCLSFDEHDRIVVTDTSTSVIPFYQVPFDPSDIDIGGVSATTNSRRTTAREQAFESINRWNLLEDRTAIILANQKNIPEPNLSFDDERIVSLLIDRWAKLNPSDEHNITFEEFSKIMHLSQKHRRLLKSTGATDLRGIAWALKTATESEKYKVEALELDELLKSRKNVVKERIDARKVIETLGKPIRFSISSQEAKEICDSIGKALQNSVTYKATET